MFSTSSHSQYMLLSLHPLELIDSIPALLLPLEAFTAFYLISHFVSIPLFIILYYQARSAVASSE